MNAIEFLNDLFAGKRRVRFRGSELVQHVIGATNRGAYVNTDQQSFIIGLLATCESQNDFKGALRIHAMHIATYINSCREIGQEQPV